jgi:hypothetical protein
MFECQVVIMEKSSSEMVFTWLVCCEQVIMMIFSKRICNLILYKKNNHSSTLE